MNNTRMRRHPTEAIGLCSPAALTGRPLNGLFPGPPREETLVRSWRTLGDTDRKTPRSRSSGLHRKSDEDPEAKNVQGGDPPGDQAAPLSREALGEAQAQDAGGAQATPSRGQAARGSLSTSGDPKTGRRAR